MKLKATAAFFFISVTLGACSYPTTAVTTVDSRPRIAFSNASPTAQARVDGVSVGQAALFDGRKNTLRLTSGTHVVEVQDGGRIIWSQSIYLGEDLLQTIDLPR